MAEGGNQLVEGWIYTSAAYLFYLRLGVKRHSDALGYLLLGLGNELNGVLLRSL